MSDTFEHCIAPYSDLTGESKKSRNHDLPKCVQEIRFEIVKKIAVGRNEWVVTRLR